MHLLKYCMEGVSPFSFQTQSCTVYDMDGMDDSHLFSSRVYFNIYFFTLASFLSNLPSLHSFFLPLPILFLPVPSPVFLWPLPLLFVLPFSLNFFILFHCLICACIFSFYCFIYNFLLIILLLVVLVVLIV